MASVLAWLGSLSPATLYASLALAAALESIFPPLPADTVVAFGAFLAARGRATAVGAFLWIWSGNVLGAMLVFVLGRRWGSGALGQRLARYGGADAEERIRGLYDRYGMAALFASRFVPGLRGLVPPVAGALRMPAVPVLLAIGTASAIWYGIVTFVSYRVGQDWNTLEARLGTLSRTTAIIGVVALALLVTGVVLARRAARR